MHFSLDKKEAQKLESLFAQHEKNLDYLIYVRSVLIDSPIVLEAPEKTKNEYEIKCDYFDKLSKLYPFPNAFVKDNILWDTVLIDIKHLKANPYLQAIDSISFDVDGWSIKKIRRPGYTLVPYQEEYNFGSNYTLKMSLALINDDYLYPSIRLYDQEWMSLNQHEIRTMETPIAIAKGKVLTLGLGLGYFAYMVDYKDEVNEVHVVEMDLELINLFKKYLLPLFPHPEKVHIHKADAYYFIQNIKDGEYNFIFSDLWQDVGDGLASYLKLKKVFNKFTKTTCSYWIEEAIVSYLRLLVIGVMKNEYYHLKNDDDEIQTLIKEKLKDYRISSSTDIDALLCLKGLNESLINND